jgi:hypothetical protein
MVAHRAGWPAAVLAQPEGAPAAAAARPEEAAFENQPVVPVTHSAILDSTGGTLLQQKIIGAHNMSNLAADRVRYTLMDLVSVGEALEKCLEQVVEEGSRSQLLLAIGLIARLRKAWHGEEVEPPSLEEISALRNVGAPLQLIPCLGSDAGRWLTFTKTAQRIAEALEEEVQPSVRGNRID